MQESARDFCWRAGRARAVVAASAPGESMSGTLHVGSTPTLVEPHRYILQHGWPEPDARLHGADFHPLGCGVALLLRLSASEAES